MTKSTQGSGVGSMSKSLSCREQKSLQHSEQGAVALCSTLTEKPSNEKTKKDMVILLSLLQGITENVLSADTIILSKSNPNLR